MCVLLVGSSVENAVAQTTTNANVCDAMTKIMENHPLHFKDVAGDPIMEEPYHYRASFVYPNAEECVITIDERNEDDPETEYYALIHSYPKTESAAAEKAYLEVLEVAKGCLFFDYWKEKDHAKFPTDKVPLADQAKYTFKHYEFGHHLKLTVGIHSGGDQYQLYMNFLAYH